MTFFSLLQSNRKLARALAASTLVLGVTACDITDTGQEGDLGRGIFFYECDNNPDDGFCDRDVLDREFPSAVAVGAVFHVDYEAEDSGYYEIVSGCIDCLDRNEEGFVMEKVGRAPLFVENSQGEVFDVIHLEAKEATSLVVRVDGQPWPDGELLLNLTQVSDFNATPRAEDSTELGGALDYTWEIADESILQAVSSKERNDIEVAAIGTGETTITVMTDTLTVEIPVRVQEVG